LCDLETGNVHEKWSFTPADRIQKFQAATVFAVVNYELLQILQKQGSSIYLSAARKVALMRHFKKIVAGNGVEIIMSDKPILNDGASVTEFDAENIQTDKEKRRDGISEKDIRKASGGMNHASPGPKSAPRTMKDAVQEH
jgi:hypothetical protein